MCSDRMSPHIAFSFIVKKWGRVTDTQTRRAS